MVPIFWCHDRKTAFFPFFARFHDLLIVLLADPDKVFQSAGPLELLFAMEGLGKLYEQSASTLWRQVFSVFYDPFIGKGVLLKKLPWCCTRPRFFRLLR